MLAVTHWLRLLRPRPARCCRRRRRSGSGRCGTQRIGGERRPFHRSDGGPASELGDDPRALASDLHKRFPRAVLTEGGADVERLLTQVSSFIEAPAKGFDLALDAHGTEFQLRVWEALARIPAGKTVSYTDIAERIGAADICVTTDIPLASRCLARSARALAPSGKIWTADNIGNALAGREVAKHMREIGMTTGGPAPLTKADRSKFLSALDTLAQAARRGAPRGVT